MISVHLLVNYVYAQKFFIPLYAVFLEAWLDFVVYCFLELLAAYVLDYYESELPSFEYVVAKGAIPWGHFSLNL